MNNLLIKNGNIVNGTGGQPFEGDVLINSGIIERVGNVDASDFPGMPVIDAKGKTVTPGFVDMHRHCDFKAFGSNFGEIELAQGITTTISGCCGLSPYPVYGTTCNVMYDFLEPCLGRPERDMKFLDFNRYIVALEKHGPTINIGSFIGTGAIKIAVKGFSNTPYTLKEMEMAKGYINEAMEHGAYGISMGIMYVPECYSSTEEFVELAKVAAQKDRILACHIRGEGDSLITSIEEILTIAEKSGVSLEISHFKAAGKANWGAKFRIAIDRIEAARAKGMNVNVDFYPYTGGSTTFLSLVPPSYMKATPEETVAYMGTHAGRRDFKCQVYSQHEGWDNYVVSLGWESIIISSVNKLHNKKYIGKSVNQICTEYGYSDGADFACDIMSDEEGKVGIIVMSMSQEDVDTVARLPYSILISDSLYNSSDSPHPRLYGSFPRFIHDYVIKRKILSLPEAVRKMTSMPADKLGLKDRGLIKQGFAGDLNIFDPTNFRDHSVFGDSKKLSSGLDYAFISGRLVWDSDKVLIHNSANVLKK